ncbi:MAG: hypothetical protein HZC36_09960 [Armatimonadetes bacterium]|nr:hypothetical protein [Armatimonadota bacterium]
MALNGSDFRWCSVGLFLAEGDRYAPYYREVLEHAGVPFRRLSSLHGQDLEGLDVLLLCGYGGLSETQKEAVQGWTGFGKALVCSGSAWGLEGVFGLSGSGVHLSRENLEPIRPDRVWPDGGSTVFFGGTGYPAGAKATLKVGDAHTENAGKGAARASRLGDEGSATGVAERQTGISHHAFTGFVRVEANRVKALFLAPHVGQTLCQMALGRSVETDAIAQTDPHLRLDDGILRAEDGIALDIERDRAQSGNAPCSAFLEPHADRIREMFVRAVVEAVEFTGASLPIFWHWPNGAPAAGALSVEAETFGTDLVSKVQRSMTMIGCRPAWLVGAPGFPLDIYRAFRAWEHEVGLLFQSDAHTPWTEDKLKMQQVGVSRTAAVPTCTTVRPSNGQWQGWAQFYEFAEHVGARVSASKGGRQPGSAGFAFGTSHPFFPCRPDGTSQLIMELPYTTYMPGVVTPDSVAEAILEKTLSSHGCFQIVVQLDPATLDSALNSARRLMASGRQRRMVFMRPDEIHAFEKGRRTLKTFYRSGVEGGALSLSHDHELEGLTILFVGPRLRPTIRGKVQSPQAVDLYGTKLNQVIVNLQERSQLDILLAFEDVAKAA